MLLAEIREQPAALRRLLEHADEYAAVAAEATRRGAELIRFAGHGSSDNAASYGVYAFGLLPGWTALRDSISLSVYYGAPARPARLVRARALAVRARRRTCSSTSSARGRAAPSRSRSRTSRTPRSRTAAEALLPLAAGPERAIAATKTYTNQIAALALLAGHAAGRGAERRRRASRAPQTCSRSSSRSLERRVSELAVSLAFVGRMFVIGRGPEFATAREISLKLLETCRVAAEPLTATDLVHGPVAALDGLFPVWTIASADESLPAVREAAARAHEAGATLIASGTGGRRDRRRRALPARAGAAAPLLTPLLSVAPGQLLAWALAQARGLDPDSRAG